MSTTSAATFAPQGPAPSVTVLRIDRLTDVRRVPRGSRVVVDATHAPDGCLPALASAVRWRRRLRAGGGTLVLAANDVVTAALSRTGLRWVLPHCPTVDEAVAAASAECR